MIPILILTLNRPLQLEDMISSIEERTLPGSYHIIICDNGSTQSEMNSLLARLSRKYTVIYNKENMGFRGFNEGLKLVQSEKFILSDPDIRLNPDTPKDWINTFSQLLDISNAPKVGVALNIDFNSSSERARLFHDRELPYWERRASYACAPCYYASVDTTLAMYRKDTFVHWKDDGLIFNEKCIHREGYVIQKYNPKYKEEPIRVAGSFKAEHMGWYVEEKYMKDWDDYSKNANAYLSSTLYLAKHQRVPGLDATQTPWPIARG